MNKINSNYQSKIRMLSILTGVFFVCFNFNSLAINNLKPTIDSLKITFINQDLKLDPDIIKGLKSTIYNVYPKLVKDFNKNARMDITIKIDTTYDGVAYANSGKITVSSQYLHKRPNDLDLITHEIMHLIQSYPYGAGPSWLTEGIADFVRYKYGVDNVKADWYLTEFSENQHYTNSYRISARFLLWVSQNYDQKLVYKLDKKLRSNSYSNKLWNEYTGFSLDQLWYNYSKNPIIKS
ncbi:basic secretory family protein [Confluentibacter sediminis]|uniref:basic secretory family protein n=1 Tax=Confluentibacter sediminis TaxID=2219045 RepID=UPI001F2FC381|nr:basic secretory family protein [Confluentibacter sediminis]